MSGGEVGMGIVVAAGTAAAVATPYVLTTAAIELAESPPSNMQSPGVPVPEEVRARVEPTPVSEQDPLGSYNPEPPPQFTADSRKVTNTAIDWLGVSASGFYVFDSGIDLQHHTGWGGVTEFFVVLREADNSWYSRVSADFAFFETNARVGRGGAVYHEQVDAYQGHLNLWLGARYGDFDFGAMIGAGVGVTDTRNTHYNEYHGGDYTSVDALLQVGARLTYRPTDWCNLFVGYRVFWNVSYDRVDVWRQDEDSLPGIWVSERKTASPSLSIQAVEVGVSILF
jgi:hypothetical protein